MCEVIQARQQRMNDNAARREIVQAIKDPQPDLEAEMLSWMRDDPGAPA
jgi:hypothetical protein